MMFDRFRRNRNNVVNGTDQGKAQVKGSNDILKELDQFEKLSFSSHGEILGNRVATLHGDFTDELGGTSAFRGNVSLTAQNVKAIIDNPPVLDEYQNAVDVCPTAAIKNLLGPGNKDPTSEGIFDTGKCILCGRCQDIAPNLFKIKNYPALAVKRKSELLSSLGGEPQLDGGKEVYSTLGEDLKCKIGKILGRSLAIREVDAGSCNGCEVEITALNNPIYDIERFGVHFVASPRHADVLLVTGPASRNMEIALRMTHEATPDPKIVIAVGACACSGGIFGDTYATTGGIDNVVPVDVYIPGCPPRPAALLYGLLLAVDRLKPNIRKEK